MQRSNVCFERIMRTTLTGSQEAKTFSYPMSNRLEFGASSFHYYELPLLGEAMDGDGDHWGQRKVAAIRLSRLLAALDVKCTTTNRDGEAALGYPLWSGQSYPMHLLYKLKHLSCEEGRTERRADWWRIPLKKCSTYEACWLFAFSAAGF